MQTPTMKTPVSRCIELATYASRMMSKFTANAVLAQLAARMQGAGESLAASQATYQVAVLVILPTRVDVKYADLMGDRCVRRVQTRAELADGKKGGPIAAAVLPDGAASIARLKGASQVQRMLELEADIDAAAPIWPEAPAVRADVAQHRTEYDLALQGRRAARLAARSQRALRDAEKQRFLATYEEIARTVQAQFPRDREMQDLFFDAVKRPSASESADSPDEEMPEEPGDAPLSASPS